VNHSGGIGLRQTRSNLQSVDIRPNTIKRGRCRDIPEDSYKWPGIYQLSWRGLNKRAGGSTVGPEKSRFQLIAPIAIGECVQFGCLAQLSGIPLRSEWVG
jgi:hypothetical protein